jgi:hypothetical protein
MISALDRFSPFFLVLVEHVKEEHIEESPLLLGEEELELQ